MITLNKVFVKNFNHIILNDITFSINKGDIISVIGQNGAGKSTLCKLLIGAINPTKGKITKNNHLRVSYVPQIIERNILLPITVKNFLLLGQKKQNKTDINKHLYQLTQQINLEEILNLNLSTLSGGEMQKVLLVRSLLRKPHLLILDEAFSFLDLSSLLKLHDIIFAEQKKYGFAMIIISHDINFVIKKTNYILCLKKGKIHCYGNCSDIKATNYIKDVIGQYIHKNE